MAKSTNAKDLDALRGAVVDAAGVSAGLWLSYLFVLFYLAIAVGGITHRDLLFQSPVKLPFLNVDLPLIGFFVLAPGLFLIVHAYVLLHFVLLASKAGFFHTELDSRINDEDAREQLRRQLPSNIFVQFLAGPREVRTGLMGFMLRLITQISLVIAPVALLVLFQLQFLPFHHEPILWWQRIAVVADLVLLWAFWPSVASGQFTRISWRDLRRRKIATFALVSSLPVLLVFTIATFPGEWLDTNLPAVNFVPTKWPGTGPNDRTLFGMGWMSPHQLLVGGRVDPVARKPTSLWSNRLVLPGIDVIDHSKLDTEDKVAAVPVTLSLRGRRLEGAVLDHANLRKVDLTNAQLQGALLDYAQLQGTSLESAQLQGAWLSQAQLRGAVLYSARLQGARLGMAQLQGASLDSAQLQGATLDSAQLQGASLNSAQLQGASLKSAELQGALLDNAQLQGASLEHAAVWRARGFDFETSLVDGAELDPYTMPWKPLHRTQTTFTVWRDYILKNNSEWLSREAIERISALDPALDREPNDVITAESWKTLLVPSQSEEHEKQLATFLGDLACSSNDLPPYVSQPYVARGLLRNDRIKSTGSQVAAVVDRLRKAKSDQSACPGVKSFTDEDWASLNKLFDPDPNADLRRAAQGAAQRLRSMFTPY